MIDFTLFLLYILYQSFIILEFIQKWEQRRVDRMIDLYFFGFLFIFYLLNLFAIHFATKQLPVRTTKVHYIWEKGEDCTYEHKWSEEVKVVDEEQGDLVTFQKEM